MTFLLLPTNDIEIALNTARLYSLLSTSKELTLEVRSRIVDEVFGTSDL